LLLQSKSNPLHLAQSCIAGYENLVVWADLLDAINVFPVADGDTGKNLRVSLSPLRDCTSDMNGNVQSLTATALGNSGNIAAAFLGSFLQSDGERAALALQGQQQAYQAVHKPVSGTMLDVFDALVICLQGEKESEISFKYVRQQLKISVTNTATRLSALEEAGVVDSGALGMFVFFDGFFQQYIRGKAVGTPVMELFANKLQLAPTYQAEKTGEHCVEVVLAAHKQDAILPEKIATLGESAVVIPGKAETKVHLHTRNPSRLREQLSTLGSIVSWSDEAIDPQLLSSKEQSFASNCIRIMSDAAGSIPLSLAQQHGIVLLDSYIVTSDQALPESLFLPEKLYPLMVEGATISTAQASNNERHLHYQAACAQYEKVLYICTGSAFTGNYATARKWKEKHEAGNTFQILDSGAASGRLAVIALLAARFAETGVAAAEVISLAEQLSNQAKEYVFIDELKYLVAGGRVSKTKAFFADLLHMKPVISPEFDGVRKVGVVRNAQAQLAFALEKLETQKEQPEELFILLQYSDNKTWLQTKVKPAIRKLLPNAELLLVPLSLTSGVHMGPGTWSIAYARK
jgi:DegV family protein with EDD domain